MVLILLLEIHGDCLWTFGQLSSQFSKKMKDLLREVRFDTTGKATSDFNLIGDLTSQDIRKA